ncbi:MAG TPA: GDP-mannose 4,6-dehydratase [Acidimicrobiales bacterium]|nr:GDP-mannose 4,6-dehydratase [Acidimicrobiales bacterium]
MRALVTGSSGFVGRHLLAHLTAEGDEPLGLDRADGVDITDPAQVHAAVADAAPEVVYHLAGFADVGASWDDPAEALRVNAEGTLHVLTAARAAGARRVLVVGSADVYGTVAEADLPLDEDQPLRPTSPYAASKVAADFLALQAWLGHGLETLRIRAFNHLGPGQSPRFVAPAIAERVARNERDGADVVELGNVTPRRDFTDVRDVVRAYRLAMLGGEPGAVYHVCSGRDVSIGELAEQLLALADRPMRLAPDPALQRPVDLPVLRGDAGRLRAATGWTPEIPLERTLADLLDDARARLAAG